MNNDLTKDINQLLLLTQNENIIKIDDARNYFWKMKKELILKQHKYEIWQGSGKDKRWKTHLPPDNRIIARKTKESLEDAIVAYYTAYLEDGKKSSKKRTLKTIYDEWLENKALITVSQNTVKRIDDDWKKYYLNNPIINIPLNELDYSQLTEWAYRMIKEYDLTKKQYYNMQIIMRQGLDYAVEKKYIQTNPFEKVKIKSNRIFRPVTKPKSDTQVFLVNEQPLIEQEAYQDYLKTGSALSLSIILAFQTGLRIGELVALKYSDIVGDYLYIVRMEVRNPTRNSDSTWTSERCIVHHAKSEAGIRKVYLTAKAKEIIKLIKECNENNGFYDDDYMFLNENGRVHTSSLCWRLKKCCKHAKVTPKSMHKIRKTFISTLIDNDVNIDYIRELVGHKSEITTYNSYCFNRLSDKSTEMILEKALNNQAN